MNRAAPISSGDDALTAVELLTLEPLGEDRFRSWRNQDNRAGAIFGGQPLAQALIAAQTTVAGWPVHHLAAQFIRSGDYDRPVDYAVERSRDGRRYASRRILATQDGRAIFDCLCAFHDTEESVTHAPDPIGDVPPPETLPTMAELGRQAGSPLPAIARRSLALPFPVEIRMADPRGTLLPGQTARRDIWFRVPTAASLDSPAAHRAMLAFASDYWLAGAAAIPHQEPGGALRVASLNHALWFHADLRADEWLLFRTSGPWAGEGRGLAHGLIFARDGRLVASAAQEASLRRMAAP